MRISKLICACGNTKEEHQKICGRCYSNAREFRLGRSIKRQKALGSAAIFFQNKSVSDKVFEQKFKFFLGLLENG